MQRDNIPDKMGLRDTIRVSMETITIGSLAAFEDSFGDLWGHGKADGELTEDERAFRERWRTARKKILTRSKESQGIVARTLNRFSIRKRRFFEEF